MSAQPTGPRNEDYDSSQGVTSDARAAGQDIKDTSMGEARNVAETAASEAKNVAGDIRHETTRLLSETKGQVSEEAKSQMGNAAQGLRQIADEMTSMAARSEQSGLAPQLVQQGGDLTRQAADYLQDRDPAAMFDDLRSFARRKPGTFLIGAAVLGVVVGRLSRAAMNADGGSASSTDSTPHVAHTSAPSAGSEGDTSGYAGAAGAPLFPEASASTASGVRVQPPHDVPVVGEPVGNAGLRP